ncbi:MAG: hypothetical protein IIW86_03970 [Clostridia bacterium]|nr:hypothetical protein [Clostridia bacterium]
MEQHSSTYLTVITTVSNKVLKSRAAIIKAMKSPSLTKQERDVLAVLLVDLSAVITKALK